MRKFVHSLSQYLHNPSNYKYSQFRNKYVLCTILHIYTTFTITHFSTILEIENPYSFHNFYTISTLLQSYKYLKRFQKVPLIIKNSRELTALLTSPPLFSAILFNNCFLFISKSEEEPLPVRFIIRFKAFWRRVNDTGLKL